MMMMMMMMMNTTTMAMTTDFIVTSSHLTWPLSSSSSSSSSSSASALSSSSSRRNAYHHLHLCRSPWPWPGAGARTSTRTGRSYQPLSICAISSNDFKTGTSIEFDGSPWKILEFLHVKPGKGAAFVRTKLKNYITGNTMEKTFRAGESVDEARVEKDVKQFTYKEGDQYVFMDMATYEESRLNESDIGDKNKWLKEGMDCNVLAWNGRVIDVEVPINVKLKIVETDPGVKGDTAQGGGSKPATLETGAVVNVPLFVNSGDTIIVDTRTGSYLSRA